MTPQQIRNEVEKGCGNIIQYDEDNDILTGVCGMHDCGIIRLCPSCLAKLSILTEYDKAIKEMILEFRTCLIGRFDTHNDYCILVEEIDELLSKIGDNSEVEK